MKKLFVFLYAVFAVLAALIAGAAQAAESAPVDSGKVIARLVSSHDVAAPGSEILLALSTDIDPLWHTYWKNPGDSGEPVEIFWADNPDISFGDIIWPLPAPVPTGPIVNYGFEGRVLFPVPMQISPDVQPGDRIQINAEAAYLVCYDICIPESANLSLEILIGEPVIDNRWDFNITKAIEGAPEWLDAPAKISHKSGALELDFQLPVEGVKSAYFFSETPGEIAHSEPQSLQMGTQGLRLNMPAGFDLQNGLKGNMTGVLRLDYEDETAIGHWIKLSPNGKADIGTVAATNTAAQAGGGVSPITLWGALIGAFLGGLILNLMPCVFPVISMKALSFARHAHAEAPKIRREGWLYSAGVFAAFMILTTFLLALKAAGAQIGWGFQLQNPLVVALLALLFFAIALNLIGGFEISLPANGLAAKQSGAFWTGVLAVIVATPCTAPFMAGAIGFAFVQPAFVTVLVFAALAIGFALPFLLLSYQPKLLARLPKPGAWMETFRNVLGYIMFGAVIWLVWVLSFQTEAGGIAKMLGALLAFAFGVFAMRKTNMPLRIIGAAALLACAALILSLRTASLSPPILAKDAWSPEKVTQLRAEGQNVFVDFTAAWCVTCKVNERLVLNGAGDVFEKHNTAFLVADWTNKDDVIAAELARHGRSGVPLYLLYPAGSTPATPQILPQILTGGILEDALKDVNGK